MIEALDYAADAYNRVIVFHTENCMKCRTTERALAKRGVPFESRPVTDGLVVAVREVVGPVSAPVVLLPSGDFFDDFASIHSLESVVFEGREWWFWTDFRNDLVKELAEYSAVSA